MKIYYYSHSGNTANLAKTIAGYYKTQAIELKCQKPYGKILFYLQSLGQVLFQKYPSLEDYEKPDNKDPLFICSPVWADNFAAPINTFIRENDFSDCRVILVSSSVHSEPQVAWDSFKVNKPEAKSVTLKNFTTKKNPMVVDRTDVVDWLKNLKV